jgi:hypothetical protein
MLASCGGGTGSGDGGLVPDGGDLGAATCEYPQQTPPGEVNDPRCPAQYGGAMGSLCFHTDCTAGLLSCRYYGQGDGRPGCYAIALMTCNTAPGDGGTRLEWVCDN